METFEYKEKLTISACEEYDNIVNQFRARLLKEAYLIATKNQTSDKEISLNDILEANKLLNGHNRNISSLDEDINESLRQSIESVKASAEIRRLRRAKLMLLALATAGIIYVLAGFIVYIMRNNSFVFHDSSFTMIAFGVVIILLSIVMGALTVYQQKMRIEKRKESIKMNETIIKFWSRIDSLSKLLMENQFARLGNDNNKRIQIEEIKSHVDLIYQLLETDSEKSQFEELLNVRNKIIHGDSFDISIEEKEDAITVAYSIINKLEGLVNNDIPLVALN